MEHIKSGNKKICSLQQFKNKIQRDKKLITSLSFGKEACLIKNKKDDFFHFLVLIY